MLADEDHPMEDAVAAQVAEPQVMVVYRRQGVPWVLVPPLLLIAAVGGIIGYRKTVRPERPIVIAQAPPDEITSKDVRQEVAVAVAEATPPTPTQEKAAPVVVTEAKQDPSPTPPAVATVSESVQPPSASAGPQPVSPPAEGAKADRVGSPFDVVEPRPADAPKADRVGSPFDVVEPRPADPPIEPPAGQVDPAKRDPVGFDPDAARVTLDPAPGDSPTPAGGRQGEGVMKPKTEEVLSDLQREAEARQADRARLEAAKPDLLKGDPRETRARIHAMMTEARREAERQRIPFHTDLRRILAEKGNKAGQDVQELFETYGGRDCLPEIAQAVNRDLVGPASRLTQQARVERMRRWGQPEQLILEDLVEREKLHPTGRGGRRSLDQIWAVAAKVLLTMPPKDHGLAPPNAQPAGSTPDGSQ
jgi:hypothetical protein